MPLWRTAGRFAHAFQRPQPLSIACAARGAPVNAGRRYRVLETVGRGGFGTIYRVEMHADGDFTKIVALKVLNQDVAEVSEMAQRLRDEARMLAQVRHRAIVQVDGLLRVQGRWAVVMEFIEGADLKQVLRAHGRIPAGPALEVTAEVAGALDVAYNRPGLDGRRLCLLHRDVKPSNLHLTLAGEVKLLDFGIARAEFAGREAESSAHWLGSRAYAAPERLDDVEGPEGDVYSLGVVLAECLTGVVVGQTGTPARHAARLAEVMAGLSSQPEGSREGLSRLLSAMLALEPEGRPTAREVERRCRSLLIGARQAPLRDWCEEVLPALIGARCTLPDDALCGTTLIELGPGVETPPGPGWTPVEDVETLLMPERDLQRALAALGLEGLTGAPRATLRPIEAEPPPVDPSATVPLRPGAGGGLTPLRAAEAEVALEPDSDEVAAPPPPLSPPPAPQVPVPPPSLAAPRPSRAKPGFSRLLLGLALGALLGSLGLATLGLLAFLIFRPGP